MKKTWIFLLLGALCHGCKDKNPSFRLPPDAVAEISVTSLSVDTLWLDTVPTSYMIESGVCDDYLYVVDKKLCVLYRYEPTGRLRDKKLGVGHARNETEVGQVYGCCMLDGGGILLSNSSGWYYSYDKDFLFKDHFFISYNGRKDKNQVDESIFLDPLYYSHGSDMHFRSYGDCIYCTMHGVWVYDYIDGTELYLDKAAHIMEVDLGKHGFGRLLAFGYPESYYDKPLTKTLFAQLNFDIADNGDFYVSFEADSLMYRYDHDYNQLACFGFAGRDMDLNYLRWDSYDQPWKERLAERMSRGFYNAVEYVDETGLLFRSYRKGGGSVTDGLQVYRDGVLVGDVDVPLGFRMAGYVAPYYYSYVVPDEEGERLYMFRFKWPSAPEE